MRHFTEMSKILFDLR